MAFRFVWNDARYLSQPAENREHTAIVILPGDGVLAAARAGKRRTGRTTLIVRSLCLRDSASSDPADLRA